MSECGDRPGAAERSRHSVGRRRSTDSDCSQCVSDRQQQQQQQHTTASPTPRRHSHQRQRYRSTAALATTRPASLHITSHPTDRCMPTGRRCQSLKLEHMPQYTMSQPTVVHVRTSDIRPHPLPCHSLRIRGNPNISRTFGSAG